MVAATADTKHPTEPEAWLVDLCAFEVSPHSPELAWFRDIVEFDPNAHALFGLSGQV